MMNRLITSAVCRGARLRSARGYLRSTTNINIHTTDKKCSSPPFHLLSSSFSSSQQKYIHPLSQIVLDHIEESDFSKNIHISNDSIQLEKDGTFTMTFIDTTCTVNDEGHEEGRIWTAYDAKEKKHWLTVHKGELVGRYLLQDNMKPAWHSDKRSVPDKIKDAVDEMMNKLSEE